MAQSAPVSDETTVVDGTVDEEATEAPAIPDIRPQLEAAFAERAAARQARTVTIQELFGSMVSLVASATGKRYRDNIPTVSEQSAVKILELSMGWALNSRQGAVNPILEEDLIEVSGGAAQEEAPESPTPDEVIEAADDTAVEE